MLGQFAQVQERLVGMRAEPRFVCVSGAVEIGNDHLAGLGVLECDSDVVLGADGPVMDRGDPLGFLARPSVSFIALR